MGRKYLGPASVEKLINLIMAALDKKQDKMDEITKDEVYAMWKKLNASDEDEEEDEEEEEETDQGPAEVDGDQVDAQI